MKMPITIAVDAMGGENSPDKVLEGIKIHSNLTSDIRYKVFGDKDKINSLIKKYKIIKLIPNPKINPILPTTGSRLFKNLLVFILLKYISTIFLLNLNPNIPAKKM